MPAAGVSCYITQRREITAKLPPLAMRIRCVPSASGERNPVPAGTARRAAAYRWSGAMSHLAGDDKNAILDMEWWQREAPADWDKPGTDETFQEAFVLKAERC
jgi:hypothetical protein